jgi:hypothetical protein
MVVVLALDPGMVARVVSIAESDELKFRLQNFPRLLLRIRL